MLSYLVVVPIVSVSSGALIGHNTPYEILAMITDDRPYSGGQMSQPIRARSGRAVERATSQNIAKSKEMKQ